MTKRAWFYLLGVLAGCTSAGRDAALDALGGSGSLDAAVGAGGSTLSAVRGVDGGPLGDLGAGGGSVAAMALDAGAPSSTVLDVRSIAGNPELGFSIPGEQLSWGGLGPPEKGAVSSAGDVNGDGFDDLIVSADGAAYVVFGSKALGTVSLTALGSGGFTINGAGDPDPAVVVGISDWVSGVRGGDVNGDGLDDLLVAEFLDGVSHAYVVFGKADAGIVSLADLGSGGFVIGGYGAAAGDVNGDGLDDMIIHEAVADALEVVSQTYVAFGKAGLAPVSFASLGAGGFGIEGENPGDYVSGERAGDINGDGLGDIAVLAGGGTAFVVHGKRSSEAVSLAALGAGSSSAGFAIHGTDPEGDVFGRDGNAFGGAFSAAGDVNGDGLDDLVLGIPDATPPGGERSRYGAGVTYVIFGTTDTAAISLGLLEAGRPGGFAINGDEDFESAGSSVSGAGDVNGDGLDDVIVGTESAGLHALPENTVFELGKSPGMAYVVFGKLFDRAPVSLAALENGTSGGFAIDVDAPLPFGSPVAAAGDVNGDGLDDVIVGDQIDSFGEGTAYVIFGSQRRAVSELLGERQVLLGAAGDDALDYSGAANVRVTGGNGTDTLRYLAASATLDLRQGTRGEPDYDHEGFQSLEGEEGPWVRAPFTAAKSVEVIDLSAASGAAVRLDDAALRRLPQSRRGLPGGLAKALFVRGAPGNALLMDLSQYELVAASPNSTTYRRRGAFYGVEVLNDVSVP